MKSSAYVPIVCCLQPGVVARRLERDGIAVHSLDLRRRSVVEGPLFLVFVLKLVWRLARLVRTERVALIHAHMPDSIIWAAVAGAMTRTPVIGTYHGLGIMPPGRRAADPRNAVRRTLYRLAGRATDRTIAVSAPVRELLCRQMGFDERKTVLVLNGVDVDSFARADPCSRTRSELGLDGRTIIACVGRLVATKGQRFLVNAMADIVLRHPSAALLLVGDGPERSALEQQARALGLSGHVRFALERTDVAELLAMATVFVLPSFYEGIPLALVEAMAAGKPVVVTAVPGNLDVVVDDRFGVLIPPGSAKALGDAVCSLLDDPVRAGAIAGRGQQRVRTHFDAKRSLAATAALYDQVLVEHERPRRGTGG
jgi:glycosyltransferase involved in cell wall biosynthesis